MKEMILGIAVLLFAIAFALASSGMEIIVFLISLAGLAITIQGYRK
ncbi:MAG: hypothetical protein IJP33_02245 [Firmicutes bacterium]|nr:hypothetical protein [Bacillota bacterium]